MNGFIPLEDPPEAWSLSVSDIPSEPTLSEDRRAQRQAPGRAAAKRRSLLGLPKRARRYAENGGGELRTGQERRSGALAAHQPSKQPTPLSGLLSRFCDLFFGLGSHVLDLPKLAFCH